MEALPSSSSGTGDAAEIEAARQRLRDAKALAEAARDAPQRTAFWLKVAGGIVAAVGVGGLYVSKPA